ncbi:hypothetical protein GOBAR_DD26683 [Gossypium barbadense]|nr:hypothetical protein GOBAR_DD26683 [Gossypium barbadense]
MHTLGLTVSNDSHCYKSDAYGESPPLISGHIDDDTLTVAYTSNAQHHVVCFALMACKGSMKRNNAPPQKTWME